MVYDEELAQVIEREENVLYWNFYQRVNSFLNKNLFTKGEDCEELDFYDESELDIQ